jgi:DNA-binding MarR family transcriptional regulator
MECAAILMDLVPIIMDLMRKEMHRSRSTGYSLPQFRTLVYLYRNKNASLSELADHIGLQLPSMSKTVDFLVTRKLVVRRPSPEDRRHISLRLSSRGIAELRKAQQNTEMRLAETLGVLTPSQQAIVVGALQILRPVFAREQSPEVREKEKDTHV